MSIAPLSVKHIPNFRRRAAFPRSEFWDCFISERKKLRLPLQPKVARVLRQIHGHVPTIIISAAWPGYKTLAAPFPKTASAAHAAFSRLAAKDKPRKIPASQKVSCPRLGWNKLSAGFAP
ncbi:MAG: hypothetical protein LBT59_14665 [Clostridiales bacterium]|nr:hypothetical protein [Clostridiales bacterium]